MAIKYTPDVGSILLCDYSGTIEPEMCKKRPVVVLSSVSPWLCTVVPLSTTEPDEQMPWHCIINTPKTLPKPYDSKVHWLKGDMVGTVSFDRLSMPNKGKDRDGHRIYVKIKLSVEVMDKVRACVLSAIAPNILDTEEE